ncbi:sodium/glutamate symporter [Sphingobacterium faecium]|jgi:ESS family glutamate:Na+ symporter|uniref:sodium/glutamate symporter n=1 Tax=Sphingobacterium TaxID=28453 RepID=UPI0004E5F5D6|nr:MULTISPECIES: sodium/glutamate symporter [Sphingobacterium]UXD70452.1 sodium/glutamate symporter [Sphingobacterium faecium]CDS93206.1 glutamate transporter [Sphingobacterium sp. PM2-P1-29]
MVFGLFETLACACLVLLLGFFIVKKVSFFRNYNIPEPVVGGFFVAIILYILHVTMDLSFSFESSLQTTMMLFFFTSIGLSAEFEKLKKGGKPLLIFVVLTGAFIVVQNIFGISIASMLGINPSYGLIAGSITLTGGHGTGAAWAQNLTDTFHISGAMELAMACATYGLVMGGLIGGPVAKVLLKKKNINPTNEVQEKELPIEMFESPASKRRINVRNMIETLTMFAICLTLGQILYEYGKGSWIELPNFVWCLFVGVVIRNTINRTSTYVVNDHAVDVLGNTGLYLFLTIALMSLQLWQLQGLASQVLIILVLQTVLLVFFAMFITFKVMGSDYDAIVLSAGHCGFGLGATPTAVANMQSITDKYGPSHKAFLIVPMVGAFFVDILNNLFIKLFVSYIS